MLPSNASGVVCDSCFLCDAKLAEPLTNDEAGSARQPPRIRDMCLKRQAGMLADVTSWATTARSSELSCDTRDQRELALRTPAVCTGTTNQQPSRTVKWKHLQTVAGGADGSSIPYTKRRGPVVCQQLHPECTTAATTRRFSPRSLPTSSRRSATRNASRLVVHQGEVVDGAHQERTRQVWLACRRG